MRQAVALVNVLKLTIVLGDTRYRVEACVAPDRENVNVNLTENREEKGLILNN